MFGNKIVTSLIISEVNSNRNLHIRMLTSLLRHNNILSKPIHIFKNENKYINFENSENFFNNFCMTLKNFKKTPINSEYKPVGYEISLSKYLEKKNN